MSCNCNIKTFELHVQFTNWKIQVLSDLQDRLSRSTRIVPGLEGIGFQYGFNAQYMKTVKDYWMNTYDWKKQEAFLNTFPHFKTNIGGLGYFILAFYYQTY